MSAATPIVWPSSHAQFEEVEGADAFYHYNILRPLQRIRHRKLKRSAANDGDQHGLPDFQHDPPWMQLATRDQRKQAVVLVASKETIIQRMTQRTITEDSKLKNREDRSYPAARWLNHIHHVDLDSLYHAWLRELDRSGISYILVNSEDESFDVIRDEDQLATMFTKKDRAGSRTEVAAESQKSPAASRDRREGAYTKEQIVQMLDEHKFAYHRVGLPFGLQTQGADRSQTRDLIFPESLAGKSVLDVGCALGYFSFEAEARGASRIVGVDVLEDRLRDAMLLKEIKGSTVEFIRRDIVAELIDEAFDYVLLLNVIHHLKEPFRAIRHLASIARERLVIEFPTLSDPKFGKSVSIASPEILDRLPLVGASSMEPGVRQTFVFSPAAIRRVLMDHEPLFDRIIDIASPMPGRAIVICEKPGRSS
ncbi:MAG TPA: methyltransferase domain-containing protein [Thermomicrobiales bacterium]|nr:methyltransferase domain-containing protein [Thermomicrobiales bacterium]